MKFFNKGPSVASAFAKAIADKKAMDGQGPPSHKAMDGQGDKTMNPRILFSVALLFLILLIAAALSGCSNYKIRDGKLVQVAYDHFIYRVNYVDDRLYEHVDATRHSRDGLVAVTAVDGVIIKVHFFHVIWTREILLQNPEILVKAKSALTEGRSVYMAMARNLDFKPLVSSFPNIK